MNNASNTPPSPGDAAFSEVEASVALALETYANVHRGAGYNSMASTRLYEEARNSVLNACGLDGGRHTAVFCSPARAAANLVVVDVGPATATVKVLSARNVLHVGDLVQVK